MPNADADRWLDAAAALALRGRPSSSPNPAVGAIIVSDGVVVGRGWTAPGGRPHAEAAALAQAGERAWGATLFVTLEPCAHASSRGPACADRVADAGLTRVVIGTRDPDARTDGRGLARLRAAGVAVDLRNHDASAASLAGFLCRERTGRPHVTLKLAVTRDGFLGPLSGKPITITGDIARAHVHRQRALAEAICVGGATLRNDLPRLDVRLPGIEDRSPRRFVLTRGAAPSGWERLADPAGVRLLGDIQYLYVEGGGDTAQAFLEAGLVDTLAIYRAEAELGDGIPAYGLLGPARDGAPPQGFVTIDRRRLGRDMLLVYQPDRAAWDNEGKV